MEGQAKPIRPFIGAKDYGTSRNFYPDLGFCEVVAADNISCFCIGNLGFYLQAAFVKDWVDNTMFFLEVENLEQHLSDMKKLELGKKYAGVRVTEISYNDWGNEFFLYDPSEILWLLGEFK